MRTMLRGKVTLLFMMLGLILAIPAVALADNVVNDVAVGSADDTIAKGGSTTNNYWIVATGAGPMPVDGEAGCNATTTTPAKVYIMAPAGVTLSGSNVLTDVSGGPRDGQKYLQFTSCGNANKQAVTFSSNTPGNYNIPVDVVDGGVGTYNENPGTFTLHVSNVVDSVSPTNGQTGVALGSDVVANFSGAMDSTTINSDTFTLVGPSGAVSAGRSLSTDGKTATLNPDADLAGNTVYTATLEGGFSGSVVKDALGNPLVEDYSWSFTTVSKAATSLILSADPNEAYYSDNVDLTATLTKSSDSSAISGKTITFMDGANSLGTAQTDANGKATLSKDNLSVGSHSIQALFATDDDYFGSTSHSVSVTINPWVLNGFSSPVDMGTTLNTVKGGSTVPLKFEVSKATELTNTTAIKSFSTKAVPCPGTDTAVDEIEFTTTGGTSLRYDTTAGQFIQNWATPKKVGCHDVTMLTQDGSTLVAHFKLR